MSMPVILTYLLTYNSFKADHGDHGELLLKDTGTKKVFTYVHRALIHATFIDKIDMIVLQAQSSYAMEQYESK